MVVIAIIGILSAILMPVMLRARMKTYHVACTQNIRNLATALEMYSANNHGLYPSALIDLTTGSKPYLMSIETCPSNQVSYTTEYTAASDLKTYVLCCPGVHEKQLIGLVDDKCPQAINGAIFPNHPPTP